MRLGAALLAAGAAVGVCGDASATVCEDLEVGFAVLAHNIKVTDGKNANKEDGPNVELQVDCKSPSFLKVIWSPRPFAAVTYNTAGETSFASVGLDWKFNLGGGWSFDPAFGYAVHDGRPNNPYPDGSPQSTVYSRDHVELGSKDLFRTSFAVTKQVTETWGATLLFSHYSHGQVLGNGRNQGMDMLGLRVNYKLP
jgi:lipid A 3-O-deacylase